jgi:hypothetical protein
MRLRRLLLQVGSGRFFFLTLANVKQSRLRLIRSPVVPHLTKDHFGKLDAHNDATNAHGVPGYVSPAIDSQGLNLAIISGHGNDPLPTMGLYGVMSPIDA